MFFYYDAEWQSRRVQSTTDFECMFMRGVSARSAHLSSLLNTKNQPELQKEVVCCNVPRGYATPLLGRQLIKKLVIYPWIGTMGYLLSGLKARRSWGVFKTFLGMAHLPCPLYYKNCRSGHI